MSIPLTWGIGGPEIGSVEIKEIGANGIIALGEVHPQFKHLLGRDHMSLSIIEGEQ